MGVKFFVNVNFFETWSPAMAYVLGFFYADGTMIDDRISRGKYVRFINTDLHQLESIKQLLGSQHAIRPSKSPYNGKPVYVLSIGNKSLYASLEKFGLKPNKSLSVLLPPVPLSYAYDFIVGVFGW